MLVLLYDCAARVQELVDLCVRDVRLENPATLNVQGKGRKRRIVPITSKTASILKQYFLEKGWLGRTASLDFPVFMNSRQLRLSRAGIAYILGKYVEAARRINEGLIPQTVSPHSLRHSKAIHLLSPTSAIG